MHGADAIPAPSGEHRRRALARQATLTKPAGSLGRIEELAVELCALQATDAPRAERVPVIVFAGDHGVTVHGVSAYPSAVTEQMMGNFTAGGAAIAVLARTLGLPLEVVDAGTLADDGAVPGVVVDRPRRGTRDLATEPALTDAELEHAWACGRRAVGRAGAADLLILGEMGIGNTTAASAVAAALLDADPAALVGPGTGVDEAGRARKLDAVRRGLALHGPAVVAHAAPGREALRRLGGLELAALAGAIVAAAARRTPVLVDGFIVGAAALAAARIAPAVRPWLLLAHASAEPGHRAVLAALDGAPLLDLQLRLGEGSGAALALPLLRAACALHTGMATFDEAAVSGPADA